MPSQDSQKYVSYGEQKVKGCQCVRWGELVHMLTRSSAIFRRLEIFTVNIMWIWQQFRDRFRAVFRGVLAALETIFLAPQH